MAGLMKGRGTRKACVVEPGKGSSTRERANVDRQRMEVGSMSLWLPIFRKAMDLI